MAQCTHAIRCQQTTTTLERRIFELEKMVMRLQSNFVKLGHVQQRLSTSLKLKTESAGVPSWDEESFDAKNDAFLLSQISFEDSCLMPPPSMTMRKNNTIIAGQSTIRRVTFNDNEKQSLTTDSIRIVAGEDESFDAKNDAFLLSQISFEDSCLMQSASTTMTKDDTVIAGQTVLRQKTFNDNEKQSLTTDSIRSVARGDDTLDDNNDAFLLSKISFDESCLMQTTSTTMTKDDTVIAGQTVLRQKTFNDNEKQSLTTDSIRSVARGDDTLDDNNDAFLLSKISFDDSCLMPAPSTKKGKDRTIIAGQTLLRQKTLNASKKQSLITDSIRSVTTGDESLCDDDEAFLLSLMSPSMTIIKNNKVNALLERKSKSSATFKTLSNNSATKKSKLSTSTETINISRESQIEDNSGAHLTILPLTHRESANFMPTANEPDWDYELERGTGKKLSKSASKENTFRNDSKKAKNQKSLEENASKRIEMTPPIEKGIEKRKRKRSRENQNTSSEEIPKSTRTRKASNESIEMTLKRSKEDSLKTGFSEMFSEILQPPNKSYYNFCFIDDV